MVKNQPKESWPAFACQPALRSNLKHCFLLDFRQKFIEKHLKKEKG